ncbi:type II toxin-antitoxin system RatA family toxin [Candidatus Odyssella acanthamoebae]|uniref:Cyclase n=1 Tax=Candidatus Odyssella acanthamoebae TaxID=91604 RepID=A0A077AWL7_9PROT|nr:type II toxin-antitoxin system RatA family toxin [Candidatus Paracaedibacter acanthamoebae]AIK96404.1 cyclase [Candidatus Paracaedibacter acanthamoebae]
MPTHAEKKILPYTPEQLFDLIADVAHYPEFLPWVDSANTYDHHDDSFTADVMIGYKIFTYPYKCRVHLVPKERIDIEYLTGPFHYLNNHWILKPLTEKLTEIDFYIDFEFNNPMLQSLLTPVFSEAVKRMIHAFEKRAAAIY